MSSVLLFLDFDGVLHPEPSTPDRLFCSAPRLASALVSFPDVRLVVTSTWREARSVDELVALLGSPLGERVVGKTPSLLGYDYWPHRRQREVEAWLKQNANPWDPWIALDDRATNFKPFCEQLMLCDRHVGIDDRIAGRLQQRLAYYCAK